MSAKDIGRQLQISPHTVAMHWRLARLKLRARTTLHAALRYRSQLNEPKSRSIDAAQPVQPDVDWIGFIAMLTLFAAALLSVLYVLAWLSALLIAFLDLSASAPYYNMLG